MLPGGTQNTIFARRNRENTQNTELQLIDSKLHETQKTHCCELICKYTWWLNWAEHIRIQETLQLVEKTLVIVKIVRNNCLLVKCVLSVNYVNYV